MFAWWLAALLALSARTMAQTVNENVVLACDNSTTTIYANGVLCNVTGQHLGFEATFQAGRFLIRFPEEDEGTL